MAISKEDILERLVQSSEGQKIQADITREQQAERIRLQCQVTALKKERRAATAELNTAVEVTRTKLEAARQAMTKAEQEHRLAQQKLASTSAAYDGRITAAERRFIATAPQAIDDTLKWLSDESDAVRGMQIQRKGHKTDKFHTASGEPVRDWYSTARTQQDRIIAIREAREEAARLKEMVLADDELQQRLDALRDGLPEISMTYEYTK